MYKAQDLLREATECHLKGDWPRAEYLYCLLIAHDEAHPTAPFALGTLYAQANAYGRALTFLQRAVELNPKCREAMETLSVVYRQLENKPKAIEWNSRALAIERSLGGLANASGMYINDANPELALKFADECLELARTANPAEREKYAGADPVHAAGNHKALALLELGRFEEGWKHYDARLKIPNFEPRPFTCPMWDGRRTRLLAIHGEQGLGDEVMFLTCLKQLREKHEIGRIVIECNPRLVKIMEESLGVKCYGTHKELIAAEKPSAFIPMGSLPGFIWPVVPNTYLRPTLESCAHHPYSHEGPRIGLSWFGGKMGTHLQLRNTPIEDWKAFLLERPEYISLQYGDRKEEADILGIEHDSEAIADLDRLAALIRSCDLVVSVCNTTIHMAGALGIPCLVLVPSKPAWRYGLEGEKMVWYDSIRMIRQRAGEPWACVLQRAKVQCADFLRIPKPQSRAA